LLDSQFLSPLHNRRTDKYAGNTFEGRSRIVFEILTKIDEKVPDKAFIRSVRRTLRHAIIDAVRSRCGSGLGSRR